MPGHRATVPSGDAVAGRDRCLTAPTRSYQPPSAATHPAGRAAPPAVEGEVGQRAARCARRGARGWPAPSRRRRAPACRRGSGGVRRSVDGRSSAAAVSPSATSTSVASRTGAQPVGDELVGARRTTGCAPSPGTAITGMSRSAASLTVCIDPPGGVRLDHHDEVGQRRDDPVAGGEPPRRRAGRRAAPRSAAALRCRRAAQRSRWRAGRRRRGPLPTTPTGRPPASSTPRWAAPSMPEREAGHHRDPRVGELPAELAGEPGAGPGAAAGADDRDADVGSSAVEVAPGEQDGRRLGVARAAGRDTAGPPSTQHLDARPSWSAPATGKRVGRSDRRPIVDPPRLGARDRSSSSREPARARRRVPGEEDREAEVAVVGHADEGPVVGVRRGGVGSEAERDGDVGGADDVAGGALQVGDGAGHPPHPVEPARGEPAALERLRQHVGRLGCERRELVEAVDRDGGVGRRRPDPRRSPAPPAPGSRTAAVGSLRSCAHQVATPTVG